MTCAACIAAERAPRIDEFTAGCISCKGRALAAIGAYDESKAAEELTDEFKGVLRQVFGDDAKAGYSEVKRWSTRIAQTTKPRSSAKEGKTE